MELLGAKFLLSLANADKAINGTANSATGKWSASEFLKPGAWQIEYRSGKEVCDTKTLAEVTCLAGFEQTGDQCIETVSKATNLQKVLGVCIGVILTAVVLYFGYIGRHTHRGFTIARMLRWTDYGFACRQNPQKFRK